MNASLGEIAYGHCRRNTWPCFGISLEVVDLVTSTSRKCFIPHVGSSPDRQELSRRLIAGRAATGLQRSKVFILVCL